MTIFDNLDYLTSKIMLPLGGLLMALFVGYVMNKAIVKNELNASQSIIDIWFMIIKVFSPILLIIIFIQGIL
jgi:NSS family neurotransmitter:Na+ symporter